MLLQPPTFQLLPKYFSFQSGRSCSISGLHLRIGCVVVDGVCRHGVVASLLPLSLCCFHLLLVAVAGSLDAFGAVTNIIFDI